MTRKLYYISLPLLQSFSLSPFSLSLSLPPSFSLSLSLPPSPFLSPSLLLSFLFSLPLFLLLSLPLSFSPSLSPSFSPSLSPSLPPSLPLSLPLSLSPSLSPSPPSLPPSPPSLPPSLSTSLHVPYSLLLFLIHGTSLSFYSNVLLSESPSELSRMNLIQFGLSKSSCDIAKELLEGPEDEDTPTFTDPELPTKKDPSKDDNDTVSPQTERRGSVCLTKEGTIKLGQFIQKIVDSKLCRVCMDSPVSAVFCPCGHLISCYKCALECTQCPLCRSTIAYVQYVYGSGL